MMPTASKRGHSSPHAQVETCRNGQIGQRVVALSTVVVRVPHHQ